jgi:hypothetical protein
MKKYTVILLSMFVFTFFEYELQVQISISDWTWENNPGIHIDVSVWCLIHVLKVYVLHYI